MTTTSHLGITLVEQSQAQKEVTVNTALVRMDALLNTGALDKDLSTPPGSPTAGDVYIVGSSPTGDWATHAKHIAYFDQIWRFITPREGMTLWVNDENLLYSFDGSAWVASTSGNLDNIARVGINTTADVTNKLSVQSDAVLCTTATGNIQFKLNKTANTNTASYLFQTGYSGRAEFGTIGNDDFELKVSPDGSSFYQSFVVDRNNGNLFCKKNVQVDGNFTAHRSIISCTGSKTFALADADSFQHCNSASTITLTVPANSSVAFTVGAEIELIRIGAGAVTVAAGGGVTVQSKGGLLSLNGQYAKATLKKTATDTWVLYGDLV